MEKTLNILIIEDNPSDFVLIERNLWQHGINVQSVRVDTMEQLEKALDEDGWDLIFSDYSMPNLDFHDSFSYIQARRSDLPVILVTALEQPSDKQRGMECGANAYIVKSNFEQSNLIEAINRLI